MSVWKCWTAWVVDLPLLKPNFDSSNLSSTKMERRLHIMLVSVFRSVHSNAIPVQALRSAVLSLPLYIIFIVDFFPLSVTIPWRKHSLRRHVIDSLRTGRVAFRCSLNILSEPHALLFFEFGIVATISPTVSFSESCMVLALV
jgi:hypothetical protein